MITSTNATKIAELKQSLLYQERKPFKQVFSLHNDVKLRNFAQLNQLKKLNIDYSIRKTNKGYRLVLKNCVMFKAINLKKNEVVKIDGKINVNRVMLYDHLQEMDAVT